MRLRLLFCLVTTTYNIVIIFIIMADASLPDGWDDDDNDQDDVLLEDDDLNSSSNDNSSSSNNGMNGWAEDSNDLLLLDDDEYGDYGDGNNINNNNTNTNTMTTQPVVAVAAAAAAARNNLQSGTVSTTTYYSTTTTTTTVEHHPLQQQQEVVPNGWEDEDEDLGFLEEEGEEVGQTETATATTITVAKPPVPNQTTTTTMGWEEEEEQNDDDDEKDDSSSGHATDDDNDDDLNFAGYAPSPRRQKQSMLRLKQTTNTNTNTNLKQQQQQQKQEADDDDDLNFEEYAPSPRRRQQQNKKKQAVLVPQQLRLQQLDPSDNNNNDNSDSKEDEDEDMNFDDYAPSPRRRTKKPSIQSSLSLLRARSKNQNYDDLNFEDYAPTVSPRRQGNKRKVVVPDTSADGWSDDALESSSNTSSRSSSSSPTNTGSEHFDEKPAAVPLLNVSPKKPPPPPPPPRPRLHHEPHHPHHKAVAIKIEDKQTSAEGWEDDFDFDDEDDQGEIIHESNLQVPPSQSPGNIPQEQQHHPPPARQKSKLHTDLEVYLDQLDHLQSSINAVMQYEYNTIEKAHELIKYYGERPGLTHYTIEKELPRMEYGVIVGSPAGGRGPLVTDKTEIARIFHQDRTLLSRCANQSLLADLLQAFTGHDMLVRPQFLTTAIATSCRFLVDYSSLLVQAEAMLDLSLPTETGRWKIADIHVRISAGMKPQEPHVEYILVSIRPTVRDSSWNASLDSAVEVLNGLNPEDAERGMHFHELPGMNFRDVFLEQTQNLVQNSAVGFKSALKDIGSVAGIGSKLNQIPAFLPDDIVQAAEQHPQSPPRARPTSILGGLVSKLAKSVALPDEDPSLYDNWSTSIRQPKAPPPPPPPQAPPVAVSRLYNRPEADAQTPAEVPKLYNRPEAAPTSESTNDSATKAIRFAASSSPPVPSTSQQQRGSDQLHLTVVDQPVKSDSARIKHKPPPPPPRPAAPLMQQHAEGPVAAASDVSARPILFSAATREKHRSFSISPSPSQGSDGAVKDGWGSDFDDDDLEFEKEVGKPQPTRSERQEAWTYNPEDDIIPTRKRWINPHPGPRELVGPFT